MASTNVKTVTKVTEVTTSSTSVELDNTPAASLIEEFNAAKEAIKALELQKKEVEMKIRELLAGAEVGTIAGAPRVKLITSSNSKINRDLLKSAYPEAYEATLEVKPYDFVKTL